MHIFLSSYLKTSLFGALDRLDDVLLAFGRQTRRQVATPHDLIHGQNDLTGMRSNPFLSRSRFEVGDRGLGDSTQRRHHALLDLLEPRFDVSARFETFRQGNALSFGREKCQNVVRVRFAAELIRSRGNTKFQPTSKIKTTDSHETISLAFVWRRSIF